MIITRAFFTGAIVAASFLVMPMTQAQPRNDRQPYDILNGRGDMNHSERRELEMRRQEARDREMRRDQRREMRQTCYRDNRGRTYMMTRDGGRNYSAC